MAGGTQSALVSQFPDNLFNDDCLPGGLHWSVPGIGSQPEGHSDKLFNDDCLPGGLHWSTLVCTWNWFPT